MRVFAIDPGYDRVGVACLEKKGGKEVILFSDCFFSPKKRSISERIFFLSKKIRKILEEYRVDVFVIETLFFSKNVKTALSVAEARGAFINIALEYEIPVFEFTPKQVKIAVTGNGNATKEDLFFFIKKIISLPEKKIIDDEIDAIAIALTYFAQNKYLNSFTK